MGARCLSSRDAATSDLRRVAGPAAGWWSHVQTRNEDHAALESLAKRGIDKEERDRLAALVTAARQIAGSPPPPDVSEEQQAKDLS